MASSEKPLTFPSCEYGSEFFFERLLKALVSSFVTSLPFHSKRH